MENKKINLSISEGIAFYGHEASINYGEGQFIFDFKCITPRIDPRSRDGPVVNLSHNVVMVNPEQAKSLYSQLGELLGKYEDDGAIVKEEKIKELEVPNYFG
ncbi:hypothetical protein J4401_04950 [Candidatus Woesearchaeota archaeon]|nr:hypothetical protein [Candidatus Woesearchaeota archaeon]